MRRRGFILTDSLAGLALLAALATLLAVAMSMRQKTAQHLADQRAANDAAQEALVNLQSTGQAKVTDEAAEVQVDRTGKHVGGKEWVEVKVRLDGRHASIIGLAPATQPAGGS